MPLEQYERQLRRIATKREKLLMFVRKPVVLGGAEFTKRSIALAEKQIKHEFPKVAEARTKVLALVLPNTGKASGVVFGKTIITATHVIEDQNISLVDAVHYGKTTRTAKLTGEILFQGTLGNYYKEHDDWVLDDGFFEKHSEIAILPLPDSFSDIQPFRLCTKPLRVGQPVFTIGYAGEIGRLTDNHSSSILKGSVMEIHDKVVIAHIDSFYADLHGNSGGALVDENCDLVGISSMSIFNYHGMGGVTGYFVNLLGSLRQVTEQFQ